MADENKNPTTEQTSNENVKLEGGTYEIIKSRLNRSGSDLRQRIEELNVERKKVFGSVEMKLMGNSRINTANNCIARDIFAVGNLSILGYNVHIGLRTEMKIEDVFSIYEFRDEHFHETTLDLLTCEENKQFVTDFYNLYRFYKNTVFAKFAKERNSPYVYMIFQLSDDVKDTKAFKWAIKDNTLTYITTPGEKKYEFPNQYEFEWKPTSREMFRQGKHEHISILDRVFVETTGGDLTIKVDDNTEIGHGIYSEEVEDKTQKLDDADVRFADLGNLIALQITPRQEAPRYFIFNEKLEHVQRIDSLRNSGILLPGGQGLIFSNGFYLQTGDYKMFDKSSGQSYIFEQRIQSSNGEDHLFVFFNQEKGAYLLLSYNVIEQDIATPIYCHGFTLFPNGELSYFRSEDNPTKHHIIQIWNTPYMEGDIIPSDYTDSFLYKIGNRDIVRAMAECQELLSLLNKDETYGDLYYDLTQKSNDIIDSYYWINDPQAFKLNEPLGEIQKSSNSAIDEFEKVKNIRKTTQEAINLAKSKADDLFKEIGQTTFNKVDLFVQFLAQLRTIRGEVISLKDLRYTNLPLIEELETQAAETTLKLSQECVEFLLLDDALQPYLDRVADAKEEIETVETARQGKNLEEKVDAIGKELELLIEIVSNLKIDDATQTTRIIDNITNIFSSLNQAKAGVKRKLRDLSSSEAIAEFAAQMKLLDQGLINYLDISDTPQKCDEYLTKLMVLLEELESKFAEFDEFTMKITEKREEIYNAFDTRKLNLVEAINKRTASLQAAAERILNGARNRANNFKEVTEINGFFASDLMIDKVREIIQQLGELGDANKASDIQTQLKTIKEDAIRQLRDKKDLFSVGGDAIKMGKHHFSVNTQKLDLTMVPRTDGMYYHLTGTGFFQKVKNDKFMQTQDVWEQALVSENPTVYRAEYLAYITFKTLQNKKDRPTSEELLPFVQKFSANRYHEGYSKGIHDQDASKILESLLYLSDHIDLLYAPATARALAAIYWQKFSSEENKTSLNKQLKSAGVILKVFPNTHEFDYLLENIQEELTIFVETTELFPAHLVDAAAEYLFREISRQDYFIISGDAHQLKTAFKGFLEQHAALRHFNDSLKSLDSQPVEQYQLARKWLQAFLEQSENQQLADYTDETANLLILQNFQESHVVNVKAQVSINDMHGTHTAVKEGGVYDLDFNAFMRKMEHYTKVIVPKFERFTQMKKDLVDNFRQELRLGEFKPRVLSSFVRNKLIDKLYLPIFGDNLAKQIGTVGDNTRTDRMGMLLLISPPGYGKTTLMEYVANRLGLIFMKINGPAIGHHVVSLDPADADNAAAKKELEKLNLSLEMGDNIMIYLDDIQHCNPEFLQKFISLTDGQRKIEGTYQGVTKTYDLRGKRVCVVMAGNPYTESGDKFQIPDMLANRSDIYNLGDIIGDTKDVFELSYIENSMTSNSVLQNLAAKNFKDIYPVVKYAQTGSREGLEFDGNHTSQELNEYVEVVKRMLTIRDAILKVNLEYIRSAAMADEYRTEPSFKLQGSYRNMNKLSEKVVPIMNDKELQTLILSHYEGESQTLTTGAEANMLRFKELIGALTDVEYQRWEEIKASFVKNKLIKGSEGDPIVQVVAQLSHFSDHLKDIQKTIQGGIDKGATNQAPPRKSGGVSFRKK